MKVLIAVLIACFAAFPQVPAWTFGNSTDGWGYDGPRHVIADHTSYYRFYPAWRVAITCDEMTDTCDSGAYMPTGSEAFLLGGGTVGGVILSADTLPSGLLTRYGSIRAPYRLCDISGSTFSLRPGYVGSVTATSGSPTVTNATDVLEFTDYVEPGGVITLNGVSYTVLSVGGAHTMTLTADYVGTTGAKTMDLRCAGPVQDFTTNGTNVYMYYNQSGSPSCYLQGAPTGAPMGTTYAFYTADGGGGISGTWAITSGVGRLAFGCGNSYIIGVTWPSGATPGDYTLSWTISQNANGTGAASTTDTTVMVDNFSPIPNTPPVYAPPIPNIAEWEAKMISTSSGYGGNWCNEMTGVPNPATQSFGNENEVWYYDGARVYSQIADYTENANWDACRGNLAAQYKNYVDTNLGSVPGYRLFAKGLGLMYEADPVTNAAYKTTVDLAATKQFAATGGTPNDAAIRETAYAMDLYATQEQLLGESANANRDRGADYLVGQLSAWCHDDGSVKLVLWFQAALAAEALISYYELTTDDRVPYILKCVADKMISEYDNATHVLPYSSYPDGPYCNLTRKWFAFTIIGNDCNDADASREVNRVLNNLISPFLAWLWMYSGDSTYQEFGDELWSYGVQFFDANPPSQGKIFSQNYRWSFDYITWRSFTVGPPAAARGLTLRGGVVLR